MALRGVVTSDWHLGGMGKVFPNGGATKRQLAEVRKVYKYAGDNAIEHVFVPGDISDKTVLSEHLIALISLLLQYDDHFFTYYTVGNHDFHSVDVSESGEEIASKTSMDVLKLLVDNGFLKRFKLFYQPETIKIDGVNVCFMPFPHTEVIKSSKPPLVFAHIEMAGAIGDNGRVLKHGNDDKFIRRPGDFIFSGHIHQNQYLKKKRFAYCGTLFQKNFGESLPKGFIDFNAKYVNGKLVVSHEFIRNKPGFILQEKLIQESADWDTLVKDDSLRYKILIGEGVVVPKNVMKEFPNIIYLNGASKSMKVKMDGSPDMTGSLTVQDLPTFSLKTGMKKYLVDSDLDKKQRIRASSLVNEALAPLGHR